MNPCAAFKLHVGLFDWSYDARTFSVADRLGLCHGLGHLCVRVKTCDGACAPPSLHASAQEVLASKSISVRGKSIAKADMDLLCSLMVVTQKVSLVDLDASDICGLDADAMGCWRSDILEVLTGTLSTERLLPVANALKVLELSSNLLRDAGARLLSSCLGSCENLEFLGLAFNQIGKSSG